MKNKKVPFLKKHKELLIDAIIGLLVLGLVAFGAILVWVSTMDIPDLSSFEQRRVLQSTKIYDRTGEILLYDLHQDVRRTLIPYEDISINIKNATVAIEDDSFFDHIGVRPFAIIRSMITNTLRNGSPFSGGGGSTITQQVIKNSILVQEKTLTRKIKEAILAIRLEQVLTKEEILNHYLNESPYGGTIYGVEEASQAFFGKHAKDIDLAEAAYLAAMPQAPTYYSPYGNHKDSLDNRKNTVLDRMLELGFISKEEYQGAKDETVEFLPQAATGIRAPHFVMYIRDQLANQYGEDALAERGFKVITTLDYDLEAAAEEIVKENALKNEKTFNASNASLVALDPKDGSILTMVGSRDYFDEDIDGNFNIALAERQPGSSFKPFVYATAFTKGYTPATTLFDVPTQFSTACSPDNFTSEDGCYSPQNYDHRFRGPISMRNALAQSLNIPAVKTLYLAGIKDSLKLAHDAGITTLNDPDRYGLTLVLGGGEVKLIDMVGAYSVFANEGVKVPIKSILRIEDSAGNVIYDNEDSPSGQRVLDTNVAREISDVLSDNVARTPLYGSNSLMYFGGRDVAAKTGTTNDKRDAWILGYTPSIVVGAWAGNNNNESMNEISGLIITPLWREFMDVALEKLSSESFNDPEPIAEDLKPVLRSNGLIVDPTAFAEDLGDGSSNKDVMEAFYQNIHSILYYVNKDNPLGPVPSNPSSDAQFPLWEYGVTAWKGGQFSDESGNNETGTDTETTEASDGIDVGSRQ